MKETNNTFRRIILNYIMGYLKRVFFSWSISLGLLLIFIPLSTSILVLLDLYNPSYASIATNFLKDLESYQNTFVFIFLIVLPFIVYITEKIFGKDYETLEHKFVLIFFIICGLIMSSFLFIGQIFSLKQYNLNNLSFSFFASLISGFLLSLCGYYFYHLSEYFEDKIADSKQEKNKVR